MHRLLRLRAADSPPAGVRNTDLFHPVNRSFANPLHPRPFAFSLRFRSLMPEQWAQALVLSDAERVCLSHAVEMAEAVLTGGATPSSDKPHIGVRVAHVSDGIRAVLSQLEESSFSPTRFRSVDFQRRAARLPSLVSSMTAGYGDPATWRRLLDTVERLRKNRLLDHRRAGELDGSKLFTPKRVSLVDLSDVRAPGISQAMIADVLGRILDWGADTSGQMEGVLPKAVVILDRVEEMVSPQDRYGPSLLSSSMHRLIERGPGLGLAVLLVSRKPDHLPDWLLNSTVALLLHRMPHAALTRLNVPLPDAERVTNLPAGRALVLSSRLGGIEEMDVEPPACHLSPEL